MTLTRMAPVTQDPDHLLLQRIGQQDMAAYRALVARHLDRGLRVAERMLGNRQDAEDVMQESWLKVWKEAPRWRPEAKFSTWLYRVVINACIDRKRKVIPFAPVMLDHVQDARPSADETLMKAQEAQWVVAALQRLPARQRAALILTYYEEVSNQEAATMLGIRLGALQQLVFRAKQNLKEDLQKHDTKERIEWNSKRM